jgi:hypothetical protein
VRSAFEGAKIAAGDAGFEGMLTGLADRASGALNWVSQLPAPIQRTGGALLGLAAGVGPVLLGLGTFIRLSGFALGGLGFMKTAAVALGTGIQFLAGRLVLGLGPALVKVGALMAATPLGVTITLVGLLSAAGVALYKNWDTVKEKLGGVWKSIREMFGSGVEWITGKLSGVTAGFERVLNFVGLGGETAPQVDNSRVAAAVGPGRGQDGRARVEIEVKGGSERVRATATAVEDVDLQLEQGLTLGVAG